MSKLSLTTCHHLPVPSSYQRTPDFKKSLQRMQTTWMCHNTVSLSECFLHRWTESCISLLVICSCTKSTGCTINSLSGCCWTAFVWDILLSPICTFANFVKNQLVVLAWENFDILKQYISLLLNYILFFSVHVFHSPPIHWLLLLILLNILYCVRAMRIYVWFKNW